VRVIIEPHRPQACIAHGSGDRDTEHTAEPHPFARWLELLR